jgi:hypothetical protein
MDEYQCENYEEGKDQCRYYEALQGTGEDMPTGMDVHGKCKPFDDEDDWIMVEHEDCDMLDND